MSFACIRGLSLCTSWRGVGRNPSFPTLCLCVKFGVSLLFPHLLSNTYHVVVIALLFPPHCEAGNVRRLETAGGVDCYCRPDGILLCAQLQGMLAF